MYRELCDGDDAPLFSVIYITNHNHIDHSCAAWPMVQDLTGRL